MFPKCFELIPRPSPSANRASQLASRCPKSTSIKYCYTATRPGFQVLNGNKKLLRFLALDNLHYGNRERNSYLAAEGTKFPNPSHNTIRITQRVETISERRKRQISLGSDKKKYTSDDCRKIAENNIDRRKTQFVGQFHVPQQLMEFFSTLLFMFLSVITS